MAFRTKLVFIAGLVAFVAGCAPEPEPVVVPVAPIAAEPSYSKF